MKRYYDENRDLFDGVVVHASQIVLKVAPNATSAEKQEARKHLLAIRAHVVAGTLDFAEAARRYSQDTTARAGRRPRHVPPQVHHARGHLPGGLRRAVGGVSDVVQGEYGLHLITVTERKGAERPIGVREDLGEGARNSPPRSCGRR